MIPTFDLTELTRRRFLGAALGAIAAGAVGLPATRAFAQSDDVPTLDEAIAEAVGDKTVEDAGGLIDLDLPQIAENGNTVTSSPFISLLTETRARKLRRSTSQSIAEKPAPQRACVWRKLRT